MHAAQANAKGARPVLARFFQIRCGDTFALIRDLQNLSSIPEQEANNRSPAS